MNSSQLPKRETRDRDADMAIDQIKDLLKGLRYGAVQIIVQDGVIVQIDRTEKRRLRPPEKTNG